MPAPECHLTTYRDPTLPQGALPLRWLLSPLLYQETVNSARTQETSSISKLSFSSPKFQTHPDSLKCHFTKSLTSAYHQRLEGVPRKELDFGESKQTFALLVLQTWFWSVSGWIGTRGPASSDFPIIPYPESWTSYSYCMWCDLSLWPQIIA